MRKLSQRSGEVVVFAVVERILQVVALAYGVLTVVTVGFVVVEVDLTEEPVLLLAWQFFPSV